MNAYALATEEKQHGKTKEKQLPAGFRAGGTRAAHLFPHRRTPARGNHHRIIPPSGQCTENRRKIRIEAETAHEVLTQVGAFFIDWNM